ncbi:bacterial transcriptional activator domain-containing protein [Lentzea sp. DG1S-22]|uniref:AfsR/SARP family transcriptional regulator n=1 Tax=Lentzea sp. DG1S-22 TaxID=3108822 RepID=UPI002E7796ED|nr:bacterial transcriptional activator domain-containing protein [Lentzea sp. DG1S-22]WVH82018.1 bacterial transcriptional activator domain-containing protein [Lentzea sp. DG1S-22]
MAVDDALTLDPELDVDFHRACALTTDPGALPLETLSERYRARGDHHHAHQAALAAVQTDPLRESAHRTLVGLHLADGNPAQAVHQYQSYRTLLRVELGLEPSAHIHDLMRPLLRSARQPTRSAATRSTRGRG